MAGPVGVPVLRWTEIYKHFELRGDLQDICSGCHVINFLNINTTFRTPCKIYHPKFGCYIILVTEASLNILPKIGTIEGY